MKIIVVLPRFPYPLEKGDKLRAYHQLRTLSRTHELYLVTLAEVLPTEEELAQVRPFCKEIHVVKLSFLSKCWNIFCAFFKGLPIQCGYFYKKEAQKVIQELVDRVQPDRIYCQLIRTAEYVKHFPVKKIIDYQDVLSKGMQRRYERGKWYEKPFFRWEYRRLVRYERRVFDFFDEKVIITEVDRELIPHSENEHIHVIANGVDFDKYACQSCPKKEYDLIFAGNMGYAPNIEAAEYLCREVLPLLLEERPGLTVAICGANPSPRVLALRSRNVTVTGWVDDMSEWYAKSRIFIAPMHLGTGLQNKLLEAMAMRLPCITSPLAGRPLKGVESGKEILVCNTTTGYVEMVLQLLENEDLYQEIAENGYQFVKRNYNWETINHRLEEIITS
ncbi:MAG: glycosyltransferase [Bacteroidales bacterium]|nr:glycosyltransferase [Bacteroidales bacterium]